MNNKLTTLIIIVLSMLTFVLAQDPPDLPGAPNQGPIGGMVWLAISGVVLAVKKYLNK
ncbi:uncharacterized protein METZ01_LOCUS414585 [marine metagenome]|uniref:Uncharacterized protein n=1 Tax=marine metagenome TaxID=408172 RepID=A0A382WUL3_9ZZZZ